MLFIQKNFITTLFLFSLCLSIPDALAMFSESIPLPISRKTDDESSLPEWSRFHFAEKLDGQLFDSPVTSSPFGKQRLSDSESPSFQKKTSFHSPVLWSTKSSQDSPIWRRAVESQSLIYKAEEGSRFSLHRLHKLPLDLEEISLKNTSFPSELYCSETHPSEEAVIRELANLFSHWPRLRKIDLSWNAIWDADLDTFLKNLKSMDNLEILDLSHNFLTDQSGYLLKNLFQKYKNLRYIDLKDNTFSPEAVEQLSIKAGCLFNLQ